MNNPWKNLQMSDRVNNVKTISQSGLNKVGNNEKAIDSIDKFPEALTRQISERIRQERKKIKKM